MTSVTLPASVKIIGDGAFTSIESGAIKSSAKFNNPVVLPDSLTTLGVNAFGGVKGVSEFQVGPNLETLDRRSFPREVEKITVNNSEDGVVLKNFDTDKDKLIFLIQSITTGDTISDESGAKTLQEAVNEAAAKTDGGTVTLKKDIKLAAPVTIPAGGPVKITSDTDVRVIADKSKKLAELFNVADGAKLTLAGKVELLGHYNSDSMVKSAGTFVLDGDASLQDADDGAVFVDGSNAKFVMKGGQICENDLADYEKRGNVTVTGGTTFKMEGGSIHDNTAAVSNALHRSSGVLLVGNASGEMTGGAIANNAGTRGAAIKLCGDDAQNRTKFTISGGDIHDNKTRTSAGVDAAGAVFVEDNAELTMTGGKIRSNRGVNDGGVAVVDAKLQNSKDGTWADTAFVLDGGEISGNNVTVAGGGIYSYSNGVVLKSGKICNNTISTATGMGAGIYSEGNQDSYSTVHLGKALISENTARQGGGMWFCPTGEVTVNTTSGASIVNNSASEAGDDFAFAEGNIPGSKASEATLSDRTLGGWAVKWMTDGKIYVVPGQARPSSDKSVPRYGAQGYTLEQKHVSGETGYLALKSVASDDVVSLAKNKAKLFITGNKSEGFGGGIGANGGVAVGESATRDIHVKKIWNGDAQKSVTFDLICEGKVVDRLTLPCEDGSWEGSFTGLPTDVEFTVKEEPVDGYTSESTVDADGNYVFTNTKKPVEPGNPEEPGKPNEPGKPSEKPVLPQTGDSAMLITAAVAGIGVTAIVAAVFVAHKKRTGVDARK